MLTTALSAVSRLSGGLRQCGVAACADIRTILRPVQVLQLCGLRVEFATGYSLSVIRTNMRCGDEGVSRGSEDSYDQCYDGFGVYPGRRGKIDIETLHMIIIPQIPQMSGNFNSIRVLERYVPGQARNNGPAERGLRSNALSRSQGEGFFFLRSFPKYFYG